MEKKEPHENSTKPQIEREDSARRFARFVKAILKAPTAVIFSVLLGFGAVIIGVDVLDAGDAYLTAGARSGSGLAQAASLAYPILESAAVVFAFGVSLLVVASLVFRRSPRSFITRHSRFKWKWFGAGAALVAGIQLTAFAWTVGLSAPTSPYAQLASTPLVIAFCALALLFYAPAVLGEELLFRGGLFS